MKAVGIIVEYNPFHNGHKYHLEKSKELSGAEAAVAVMSSNFLQRGEPSLVDKWIRTEMALAGGVDLVVELPAIYSNQSAEIFALGAVSILNHLRVSSIVFGSETGDIGDILKAVTRNNEKEEEFNIRIKEFIKSGISYPNAYTRASEEVLGISGLYSPNNILGVEYVKALGKLKSAITPLTLKRHKAQYHSESIENSIASATAVRKALFCGDLENLKRAVPETTFEILMREKIGGRLMKIDDYYQIIRYMLISADGLIKIQDMEPGLDYRLRKAAVISDNYKTFMENVKTKRYTTSRINRILTHIMTGITTEKTIQAKEEIQPYVRLLGMNEKGMKYLSEMRKKIEVPIITNIRNIEERYSERIIESLKFETKCSDIYNIIAGYSDRKIPVIQKQEG